MKNKYLKILIVIAIALALVMAGVILVKESGLDTSKIMEVHLEYITEEGSIERVQVTDADDVDFIKVCFNGETTSDGASGFVEGGYRIVLAQPDKEWHMYPNGGELNLVRVGDSSDKMIAVQEAAELENVINKYIDTSDYKADYDWKAAIMEDIKN
jgi:hypothetical protein